MAKAVLSLDQIRRGRRSQRPEAKRYKCRGEVLSLNILECRKFSATYRPNQNLRRVKDYEIDLELGNDRVLVIDGVPYSLRRGDVCIRRPGQTVSGQDTGKYLTQTSVLLTVDFSGKQPAKQYIRHVEGPVQEPWGSDLLDRLGSVVTPHSEGTFVPIYNELLSLDATNQKAAELLVMELIYKLNAEACRQSYNQNKPAGTPCGAVLAYMKNNLERDISLEELAELVHLNKNYLVRLFKETYGKTPIRMLIQLRLEQGCDLVTNTDMPIAEIAAACGYGNAAYFIAEYKKQFGTTPLRQRQNKI